MIRQPLTMFCYTDISGRVRGKGFPSHLLKKRLQSGIAWTPTNILITALGPIAETPWGALGDLILMPDRDTEVHLDFEDETPSEHFFLGDILNTDGTPWDVCPRTFLKNALAELREQAGVVPHVTFEHEFTYSGADGRDGDGYALDAVRRHGCFGEVFLAALHAAGLDPDSYLPEYAQNQFEVTCPPTNALKACDQAVTLRELARASAFRLGHEVSFTPKVAPDGVGNGVHVHISLRDTQGAPISYDAKHPYGVSERASCFLAGIHRHMRALTAFTAPTPPSYLRLVPHTWSAAWTNIGYRHREAAIRICPTFGTSEKAIKDQYNFEYKAMDATGNPYIQLGMLLKAGLLGLREQLEMPEATEQDPESMRAAEREQRKIARLPQSLNDALTSLSDDEKLQKCLPENLLKAYMCYKHSELQLTEGLDAETLCQKYLAAY